MNYSEIKVIGRLGNDPEMKYIPKGDTTSTVTNFSVTTDKKWKDASGTEHKETLWFSVEAWGGLAELVNKYCVKGMEVLVIGEPLKAHAYLKDGVAVASNVIKATDVRFGNKPNGTAQDEPAEAVAPAVIPF